MSTTSCKNYDALRNPVFTLRFHVTFIVGHPTRTFSVRLKSGT